MQSKKMSVRSTIVLVSSPQILRESRALRPIPSHWVGASNAPLLSLESDASIM